MTNSIDTQKLAESIERVMELDAKRTQGEWYECSHSESAGFVGYGTGYVCGNTSPTSPNKRDAQFIAAAPLMADIIRQQGGVIRELRDVIEKELQVMHRAKVYEIGLAGGQTMEASHARQCMWRLPISVRDNLESALALSAPLVKKEGE